MSQNSKERRIDISQVGKFMEPHIMGGAFDEVFVTEEIRFSLIPLNKNVLKPQPYVKMIRDSLSEGTKHFCLAAFYRESMTVAELVIEAIAVDGLTEKDRWHADEKWERASAKKGVLRPVGLYYLQRGPIYNETEHRRQKRLFSRLADSFRSNH